MDTVIRLRNIASGLLAAACLASMCGGAVAQQSVAATVYRAVPRPAGESVIFDPPVDAIRCEIVSWENGRLVYKAGDPPPDEIRSQTIPESQVVGVEVHWQTAAARAANQAFAEGRWRDSILASQAAINSPEMPLWQQKLMGLQIVSAAMQYERVDLAVQVYAMLTEQGLPEFGLAYLPVPWGGEPPSKRVLDDLAPLVDSQDPTTQFIVAAWMLTGPDREAARVRLKRFATESSGPLRALAEAQLWRVEPPEAFRRHLAESLELRNTLPLSLQAGVNAAIADRLERGGELELAHSMWVLVAVDSQLHRQPLAAFAATRLEGLAQRGVGAEQWPKLREFLLKQ